MFEYTRNEIRDLIISFIILSFCFAISIVGINDVKGFFSILPIVMFGAGVGMLLHELGHKFVAMKYGYQAEFKLWPLGLLIAVVTSFFGVVFASPGQTRIPADNISDEINGKISVAGPMANVVLALIFIAIAALIYSFKFYSGIFELIYLISTVGFSVNCFIATFNLLPIYSLDGTKVLKWNIGIWIVVFAVSAIMMLISILTISPENMVKLFLGL